VHPKQPRFDAEGSSQPAIHLPEWPFCRRSSAFIAGRFSAPQNSAIMALSLMRGGHDH
jgi:hypothetical protein